MEESITLLTKLKKEFECESIDLRNYSPLTLAFLGDCVFDLIIRTVIVERGNRTAESLHKKKSVVVKAQTQARMAELLLPSLSEEELAVYKRGRNAKSYSTAKNASVSDYRKATGFEALLGYLYLQDMEERIIQLVKTALQLLHMEI
ncbi:MAG: ribonuclease III [Lachnospiraceae bacterium]|nr:ribonuclease III [Lachnospiraceae bacterium]